MKTLPEFLRLDRFGISPADVTQMTLGCRPEAIHPDVILMPFWLPETFALWVDPITPVSQITFEAAYGGKPFSLIRCGIGAPVAGDTVLALGHTACERMYFAGSVGALRADISVGDLMMPEFSYSGDGYCRYLQADFPEQDCFLERCYPDEGLSNKLKESAAQLANAGGASLHCGPVFSIESILAQFSHLDYLARELGCIGIEMETAAVFKAARLVGIRAAALFSVSDVPLMRKSLFSGRSPEEQGRRKEIRRQVLARAILDCLGLPD